jgi:hypothetical protein
MAKQLWRNDSTHGDVVIVNRGRSHGRALFALRVLGIMTGPMTDLSREQLLILGVAASDGAYSAQRRYNSQWGDDYAILRELEALGLMKFVDFERNPQTKEFARKSQITDAGKVAWEQT